jgi:hypothetical protein
VLLDPEWCAFLIALLKQYKLYPLITWDDVLKRRIHRTKDSKSAEEEFQKIAHPAGN